MLPAVFNPSLPALLATFCQNPPWKVSVALLSKAILSSNAMPKKIQVLSSNSEYHLIWNYFYRLQPTNRAIKSIYFTYDPQLDQGFERELLNMESDAKKPEFQPNWRNEEPKSQRQRVAERFQKLASSVNPFTLPGDKNPETCQHVKVLPLWQGRISKKSETMFERAMHFLGKLALMGEGDAPERRGS